MIKLWLAFTLLLMAINTLAWVEIPVITNYGKAASRDLWKNVGTDKIPSELINILRVEDPEASHSNLFPHSFFQDEEFAVCHRDCKLEDPFQVYQGSILPERGSQWDVLEESNVYYWIRRYFDFIQERFRISPRSHLKILTSRGVSDEENKQQVNNAFFNPSDSSLSFLPAKNTFLYKLFKGKINRSGFDPSVIIHEASHYLFQELFPAALNEEMVGLSEGFADYMANIMLEHPKVGLIMLQGKWVRDSSSLVDGRGKLKIYSPKMEVHDLGERVAMALWKTRSLLNDKHGFDRLVVDALIELAHNPYSTIHDFKHKMLIRIGTLASGAQLKSINNFWEVVFPGPPVMVRDFSFMQKSIRSDALIGFHTKDIFPEAFAKEMSLAKIVSHRFTIIKTQALSPNLKAMLIALEDEDNSKIYWVIIDHLRSNIQGIYSLGGDLIDDKEEVKNLSRLMNQIKASPQYAYEVMHKIKIFSGLYHNDGELKAAFKVKSIIRDAETVTLNGKALVGQRVTMQVRQKLLAKILADLPEIEKITLITAPGIPTTVGLPEVEGQAVIGYALYLKGGMIKEVLIEKITLQ